MSTPTLLVDVHNKPDDLFQAVKQRIEACRAKCKCDKENNDPDATPYQKMERVGARGRELSAFERREIAAGSSEDFGYMFLYEDFWFGNDAYSPFPCGCENYAGDDFPRDGDYDFQTITYDGHNDCGAEWLDQITGYYFLSDDGMTGLEKFALSNQPSVQRNGKNSVHDWCGTVISNPGSGDGGYSISDSSGARAWVGVGANSEQPIKYTMGTARTLGFYERTDSSSHRIQDRLVWHNHVSRQYQQTKFYTTFGSRELTGKTIGNEILVESPPTHDKDFVDTTYSHTLGSAVEYISRVVTNINSGGDTNPQYYVFTSGGVDRDGSYSTTQKRVFTIGDTVRLAVDESIQPGPLGSEGQDWVGTIVALGYGTFNMDVCATTLCNGVCSEAYIRGDIPGKDCEDIGEPPNCRQYSAEEWQGKSGPNARINPGDLLPPSEWPVIDPNDSSPNTSCNPNIYTVTGFRYTVEYSNKIPQRLGGGIAGTGTGPLFFHSYPGGRMYHAFPASGGVNGMAKNKTMWDGIFNTSLDVWIVKDGEGNSRPFVNSIVEEANHWQGEPGGFVEWGGHGGKMYFTLEAEDFRYTTDANNQQPDWGENSGFANYSPNAPYFHIMNMWQFPQKSSTDIDNGLSGNDSGRVHRGPFVQGEGPRNSYNWDRSRCGAPDLLWSVQFYEFDCASGKVSRKTGIHQETILCNCDMSYGQINWWKYTGNAAPDWWPWKEAWMQGIEGMWETNSTNTKAYHLERGEERNGVWNQGVIYSWPVDAGILREGKYEEFINVCKLQNAPDGAITKTTIPGTKQSWPEYFAWNTSNPWRKPPKWGYWYWNNYWVPPK